MTTIKIIRKFRGSTPDFVKRNKRSKGYVDNINKSLGEFSEVKRRKDLTAKQHNKLGFLPTLLRLKIPAADGELHTKKSDIMFEAGHNQNLPKTAKQHEFFSEGVLTGGYGRWNPLSHSGMRELPFGYGRKETPSAFNPIVMVGSDITQNTVGTRKGANRRATRSWTW